MKSADQFVLIKDRIHQECRSYKFTIVSLCEQLDISRATLHRVLKKHTGQSASAYINEVRLTLAHSIMLVDLTKSVKQIAKSVGYFDPKYFSKLYKEKYGISPSQERGGRPTDLQ